MLGFEENEIIKPFNINIKKETAPSEAIGSQFDQVFFKKAKHCRMKKTIFTCNSVVVLK